LQPELPSEVDSSIYDAPSETLDESDSPDGFIYFAAPEKDQQAEDDDPPQSSN
jgi:hypothetical protein